MANPFSNPAIYIDGSGDKSSSVYADYTPSSDRYTKEDVDRMNEQRKVYQEQTTKNIEAKKEEAKQKESTTNAQQKKPDDGSQWVTKLDKTKDTLISSAGVDVEKYRKALDEAITTAENLYAEIARGVSSTSSRAQDKMLTMNFTEQELSSVMGLPYQWMSVADARVGESRYGRKFQEKILSKMPIMVLTPGIPDFMAGYDDAKKDGLLAALVQKKDDMVNLITNKKGDEMRYYTLRFEAAQYYRYVDSMCTALAVFLGINNEKYNDTTLGNMKWMQNNDIAHTYSYYGGMGLYLNSETQISENFGNESTQSILAGAVNAMSDVGREIQFLTGISGFDYDLLNSKSLNKDPATTQEWIKNAKPGTMAGFLGMVMNGTKTVFAGGKLEFPELWADSSYSSSYSINTKLISPDYDVKSWFLNIGVPLMHLIALCSPRQVNPNGYISPFLVRAFYKGFFNIDMGLMSMSVQKGSEGGWTVDGLPTSVDINIEIKDLYSKFSISAEDILGKNATSTFGNVGLITYLANMAGVNTNEPDALRTGRLFLALKQQSVTSIPNQIVTSIGNSVANLITNRVFRKG